MTFLLIVVMISGISIQAQDFSIKSPDSNIVVNVNNNEMLTYSVTLKGKVIIEQSS